MHIGYDAKRLFHNRRGLGNYSRDIVRILSAHYPENEYHLFNPKAKNSLSVPLSANAHEALPEGNFWRAVPSLWRSRGICKQIKAKEIDIYHGLSQELPIGIQKTGAKSVVTMHDAIFIRYPQLYTASYRSIFTKKNEYACKVADKIIAISEQTKRDFIDFFDVDAQKIAVVYQGCNAIFRQPISETEKKQVKETFNLPDQFLLYVGAIEKRKNAALIVEAMHRNQITVPLVIVGKSTNYKKEIVASAEKYHLQQQLIFLHDIETNNLPAIYAQADIFIYPSIFEGFGIPVLEALSVGVPVITSRGSCFEETGGASSMYVNPHDADELGDAITTVLSDTALQKKMITEGKAHAERFTDARIAENIMHVYQSLYV